VPRRLLTKLTTKRTNATTSSKWIRLPPMLKANPRSHRIKRRATIVQSILSFRAHGEHSYSKIRLPALLRNSRKTERGAKQFLAHFGVRAAPFALLSNGPQNGAAAAVLLG
jgi:hypothetical protein